MNNKPIKAIFFDLGNVIVGVDPEAAGRKYHARCKAEEDEILDYIRDSDNMNRYQRGKLTSSQFYNKTCRALRMDMAFNEFYGVWNSMFYPYPETEEIIRAVRKDYPDIKLILVSDTNEAHYEFIKQQYRVLDLLDACILSYEVGRLKPHPEVFNRALNAAGSIPRDTFYTDDRRDYIDAARIMGIRAFQFTGQEQLREQLARCGVRV